jgi:adenylate cyclase
VSETAIRRLRFGSGLVLFAYIAQHLVNHALGIVSLASAEQGLRFAMAVWHTWPGTILLYGSAALHFLLALRTVFLRRHWKLPLLEIVRIGSGFSLPLLLISHVVSTRLQAVLHDVTPSYGRTVAGLVASGNEGWQLALLAPGWVHGCLGLWITLRRYDLALRLKPVLLALLVLVPLAAAFGFYRMAVETGLEAAARGLPDAERRAALLAWQSNLTRGYLLLVALAFAAGRLRYVWMERRSRPSSA